MSEQTYRLGIESSRLQAQVAELLAAIEALPEDSKASAKQAVFGYLDQLGVDLVHGQCVTTVGADGTDHVLQPIWLGSKFEDLLSAIRAGKEVCNV